MPEQKTFLLVEDQEDDAFLVELEFKQWPEVSLQIVHDGQEAIDYFEGVGEFKDRKRFPIPDIIMLDLKMPRVSGFDFLGWLNERPKYKIIPVIVMSGSGLEQDVKRAYELGANQYMVKPIDWQQFRERLRLIGVVWNEHTETPRMS